MSELPFRATVKIGDVHPPIEVGEVVLIDPEDPRYAGYLAEGDGHGPFLVPDDSVVVEGADGADSESDADDELVSVPAVGDDAVGDGETVGDGADDPPFAAV